MSVKIDASAPDGFLGKSFADDDWRDCRDHVRRALGIERERGHAPRRATEARRRPPESRPQDDDGRARALALWRSAVDLHDTLAECYLRPRALKIGDDIAGQVIRWHPGISCGSRPVTSSAQGRLQIEKYVARDGAARISRTVPTDHVLGLRRSHRAPCRPRRNMGGAADMHAFLAALLRWANRGQRDRPMALPIGVVNPNGLRHVVCALVRAGRGRAPT